jgi:septation ring formation regulator EzrA
VSRGAQLDDATVLMIVAAIVVVVIMVGPKHLSRKQSKQEEPLEISPKSSVYGRPLTR